MAKTITKMECSICYESLSDEPAAPTTPKRGRRPDTNNPKNTSVLVCLPCGHIYHRVCIEEWLLTKQNTCPSCRRKCEKRALKAVFLPTAGVAATSGSTATSGNDEDDEDDDKDEQGKGPCVKCDQLAKQLEVMKKEKEELQKQVVVERNQVKSLEKMLDVYTCSNSKHTTTFPTATGNSQQRQQGMDADEDEDDYLSDDDYDDLW